VEHALEFARRCRQKRRESGYKCKASGLLLRRINDPAIRWEASHSQRWIIALVSVAIIAPPVMLSDTNYDKPAPRATSAPAIQRIFSRAGSSLALTRSGGQPPARCCSTLLNRDEWPSLGTDESSRRDLLVLLPVDTSQRITEVQLQVAGENGLDVTASPDALAPAPEAQLSTEEPSP
jgi:hypothetical protein